MTMRAIFLWLAFIGVVLAGIAAYLQAANMDLSRFGLSEYFAAEIAIPAWWHAVALPFLVGALYLVTGLICLRIQPPRGVTFAVIVGCFLPAALLAVVNFGFGLYALVSLIPLLIGAFPRSSRVA